MSKSFAPFLLAAVSAAVLFTANPCTAQSYTLTEIAISPTAINNNGQIGGQGANGDPSILGSSGTVTDLGNFGSSCNVYGCRAYAINSLGDAVGLTGDGTTGGYKPYVFSSGTLTRLSPDNANPLGINTAGTIVGYLEGQAAGGGSDAFVIKNGVFTDLGAGEAHGVNTSGQIAGTAVNSNSEFEAAVFQPDGTTTLLGFLPGETYSRAFAINDAGQVAGTALTDTPQYAQHAFLFSNGTMTDIDTFNSQASWAFAINKNGVVVGQVANQPGSLAYHAFVFMGGSMMDLNSLIPSGSGLTLYQANGVNDAGEIVGFAQLNSDGSVHGFLLKPIAPQITSISPTVGPAGTLVTINGNHFTTKPKSCKVTINGKVAVWTSWSNTKIQVKVPSGTTTGKVVVTAFFQHSNGVTFTVN